MTKILNHNQSQKLFTLTIFSGKSPKKCLTCSNIPRIPPPLVQCCATSGKATPGSGGQANLKPRLNKGAGGASLTIFMTDCQYFVLA